MRDYHKLRVWQRAHRLTLRVYRHTATFPADQRFGLVEQMRRAAASVPANIVEGAGRRSARDYARFLDIAASSLHELSYHLELSRDLRSGNAEEGEAMRREAAEIRAMLTALRSKVTRYHDRPGELMTDD